MNIPELRGTVEIHSGEAVWGILISDMSTERFARVSWVASDSALANEAVVQVELGEPPFWDRMLGESQREVKHT